MTYARLPSADDSFKIPRLPDWITLGRAEVPEDVAFLSGAALAHLHLVVGQAEVPHASLRDRLALRAAELRDELHLLRPGDQLGPAGTIFDQWRRAVVRPISVPALKRAMPEALKGHVPIWLDAGQGGPVARASAVLGAVLADHSTEEAAALILADAALARALGWSHVWPLLSALKRRELRLTGDELTGACHRAVRRAVVEAARRSGGRAGNPSL